MCLLSPLLCLFQQPLFVPAGELAEADIRVPGSREHPGDWGRAGGGHGARLPGEDRGASPEYAC